MKKVLLSLCLGLIGASSAPASQWPDNTEKQETDSLQTCALDEVVVRSTGTFIKETNALKALPGAYSILTARLLDQSRIRTMPELTSFVPNLYIPEYGSKMSTAMYLRGIGARSSGQTVGVYVDGVPYINKSAFNFNLVDAQGIEILRGPQGTLYGRNAMAGIINIYSRSALAPQKFELSGGLGNYGNYNTRIKGNFQLSKKTGLAFAAYADRNDGYFRNEATGKPADQETNMGGRLKWEIQADEGLHLSLGADYDYSDQAAFPYRRYDERTKVLHPVDYNDPGHYRRQILSTRFLLNKRFDRFTLSSATGYQHLSDKMQMDQDYTRRNLFAIKQTQKSHSLTQEFALRGNTSSQYQWSVGLFGFYDHNKLKAPILFKQDGIRSMLQTQFDKLNKLPQIPVLLSADLSRDLEMPGQFNRPTFGTALYHQSTINNLLLTGLSATIGLRLDYELQQLDYTEEATFPINITNKVGGQSFPLRVTSRLKGSETQSSLQLLPKVALKYSPTSDFTAYFSFAKGHKAGGFNEQIFADLIMQQQQSDLMNTVMKKPLKPVVKEIKRAIAFKPENSYNYEIGMHWEAIRGQLATDASVFVTDTRDLQLTRFVDNGTGRMLVNAGHSRSIGAEASIKAMLIPGLTAILNYGFTHAEFVDYKTEKKENGQVRSLNYRGKYVPFIPQHTYALSLNYNKTLPYHFFQRIFCSLDLNGAGEIYWDESNTVKQPLYATLNGRIGVTIKKATISLWGQNLNNADYTVFYFESLGNKFKQQAKPLRFGIECKISL